MVKASDVKAQIDTHEAVCAESMIGTAGTMIVMMAGLLLR